MQKFGSGSTVEQINQEMGKRFKLFDNLFNKLNLQMDTQTRNFLANKLEGVSQPILEEKAGIQTNFNKQRNPTDDSSRDRRDNPYRGNGIKNLCGMAPSPPNNFINSQLHNAAGGVDGRQAISQKIKAENQNVFKFLEKMEDKDYHITLEASSQMLKELNFKKFSNFELLEHQKVGLVWMLEREQFYEHVKDRVPSYVLSDTRHEMKDFLHPLWRELVINRDFRCAPNIRDKLETKLERQNKRSKLLRSKNKFSIYFHRMSGQLTPDFPHMGSHINFLGGLLADEMGLGKTILLLSIIGVSKVFSDSHQAMILKNRLGSKYDKDIKIMETLREEDFHKIERKSIRKSLKKQSKGKLARTGKKPSNKRGVSAGNMYGSPKSGKSGQGRGRGNAEKDKSPARLGIIGIIKQKSMNRRKKAESEGKKKAKTRSKTNAKGKRKGKGKGGRKKGKSENKRAKKRKLGGLAGNLIVLPTMLLSQWADEIEVFYKKV